MKNASLNKLVLTILGWLIAIIFFFPIFWMAITAFKTEKGAYSPDLFFIPTLESFGEVFARSNYLLFARNMGGRDSASLCVPKTSFELMP